MPGKKIKLFDHDILNATGSVSAKAKVAFLQESFVQQMS
jgi:hypothetical protein